jgi:hypothetical protein
LEDSVLNQTESTIKEQPMDEDVKEISKKCISKQEDTNSELYGIT